MAIWDETCPMPSGPLNLTSPPAGTEHALAQTIVSLIRAASKPVLLVGTEIQRYGLADKVADLIAKLGVRWATALQSKAVLAEQGPGWLGVYDPPHAQSTVKQAVEQADLLVTLGCVSPGGFAPLLTNSFGRMVQVYDGKVRVKTAANKRRSCALWSRNSSPRPPKRRQSRCRLASCRSLPVQQAVALTYKQVFERIAVALDDSWIVIPDTFLGIYSAANLPVKGRDGFPL